MATTPENPNTTLDPIDPNTTAAGQNNPPPTPAMPSLDSIKNSLGNNEMVNKATQFAKQRPWAVATLAGVVGVAILNTLRGKS